jgi:hypothetical protein
MFLQNAEGPAVSQKRLGLFYISILSIEFGAPGTSSNLHKEIAIGF